jgi:hypothetical protein
MEIADSIKMLTTIATIAAIIVIADPVLSIGQVVHGQSVDQQMPSLFNCDKVIGNAKFNVRCNFSVSYCSKKRTYNDQAKTPNKDYTAGYKYGWTYEGCNLPK